MRIIAGTFRGRSITAPKGAATRPTADRTRESVFNLLAHRQDLTFEGARVIDLFAGSGAFGLEALSRGAGFCLFVETDAAARGAIRDNIEALGLFGATRIHRRSATDLGIKPSGLGDPFTLAFLDPPLKELGPGLRAENRRVETRSFEHGGRLPQGLAAIAVQDLLGELAVDHVRALGGRVQRRAIGRGVKAI